jgi:two-component SAPR family response regulator
LPSEVLLSICHENDDRALAASGGGSNTGPNMDEKLRVLIREDETAVSTLLEVIVGDTVPAEVLVHTTVEAAQKSIGPDLDLALLDINLSNGKSYQLAMKLLKDDVPFLFVSASEHHDMPEELRDSPFIAKPFRAEQIRDAILKAVETKDRKGH